MEEWLQELQDMFYSVSCILQYARVFAYVIVIAFIIVFIALAVINSKLRYQKALMESFINDHDKDMEYITRLLEKQVRTPKVILKGEENNDKHT